MTAASRTRPRAAAKPSNKPVRDRLPIDDADLRRRAIERWENEGGRQPADHLSTERPRGKRR
jgi:hypothetical protein